MIVLNTLTYLGYVRAADEIWTCSRAAPDPVIPTEAQRSGGISK